MRKILSFCLIVVCGIVASAQTGAQPRSDGSPRLPDVRYPIDYTVSPPVRELPPQAYSAGPAEEKPLRRPPGRPGSGNVADPVVQTSTSIATAQGLGQWEGLGFGYPGYSVTAVPPDPNIAVGPNHIVQWVNNAFVVFDKQGNQLQAPISDATFWNASPSCNQLGGFSDPIVQYDRIANRWVVGEVAIPLFPGLIGQFAQCMAVSATSDPTGSYYMWTWGFGASINDYPKIGVWPDGYYVTWNIFQSSGAFVGPEACAFNRNAMLSGASAPSLVCFKLNGANASLLPSDLDGAGLPPAGSPNFLMNVDPVSNAMNLWKFHVDFANPNSSTLIGPASIPGVAPFSSPCLDTQDCLAQPATTTKLDALGDRLMYRLAYRNFGGHESIVANHTVLTPNGNTAVRWYEVGARTARRRSISRARSRRTTTIAGWAASRWIRLATLPSATASAAPPPIRRSGMRAGRSAIRSARCRPRPSP